MDVAVTVFSMADTAFHALSYHVLEKMTEHETGGDGEKEEVLAILMSLKGDITKFGASAPRVEGSRSCAHARLVYAAEPAR